MNITLIYPLLSRNRSRTDEAKQYWPPLGLAYIAAVLRENGHSVQILDRDLLLRKHKFDFDKSDEAALKVIREFNSEAVGFSATTPNVSDVDYFSRKVKLMDHRIITVIGGPHCAGEPEATLKMCEAIDLLVRGEGEMAMLNIASSKQLDTIGNLTYRKSDGSIVSNFDSPLIDSLDSLPFPARDLLEMDSYTRPSRFISRNLSLRTTHVFTARGCPFNCNYCAGPLIGRRKVRYHSTHRVVAEIEELIQKYSVEAIFFAEDMFLSSKQRTLEIAELFMRHNIQKKIVWMAQISAAVATPELLGLMKKAGCVHVEYGFESGSQRMLDLMNKSTNVEKNKEVALLTRKSGLRFQGNFIVGYPGETEEDFNKTISFIREVKPNNVSLNIFMPLPGTEIYKKLKQEGKLLPNWDDVGNPETPCFNYADMPSHRFEELYFRAKLNTVLPINLTHFITDNILHPVRLVYIVATQFKSVVTRAFMAFANLHKRKMASESGINALFVAYHAASTPIMDSQGFSYMRGIAKKGVNYSLLTFEPKEELTASRKAVSESDIKFNWRYLIYHKKPRFIATFLDIASGVLATARIIKRNKINVVHARGFIPAVIAYLPAKLLHAKLLFDTRGFIADKYVCGKLLSSKSLVYRLMRLSEDMLLKKADYFTVETNKHAEVISETWSAERPKEAGAVISKMGVIPCCVDTRSFDYRQFGEKKDGGFRFVFLGKVGTWYLLEEMFDFFKAASNNLKDPSFTFITESQPFNIYQAASKKGIDVRTVKVIKASRTQVPQFLSESDASIFFMNTYKQYGFSPIKFAESLACGIPVIINTGFGDCEEVVLKEKVGVAIDSFCEKEYKRAAEELSGLLSEGPSLRQRCRRAAEKYYSLDLGVERYSGIYEKLMKPNLK